MNAPEQNRALGNALAVTASAPAFDLSPRNFDEAWRMAEILADSDFVPKDYKGKPGNCLVAMQWGAEVGLKALQAMQNIAVINGRPALWGDAVIALVRGSPLCEWIIETEDANSSTCRVKRRGEPEQSRTFTDEDAKAAGLLGKQGPWTQYRRRMRQMRARAFALRDVFPDVLRGLPVAEEVMDAPSAERYMGPVDEVRPPAAPTLPPYAAEAFEKNLPAWQKLVAEGKKTAPDLLATLSTKATFSEEQKAQILSLKKAEAPAAPPPPAERGPGADDDWTASYDAAEEGAK
jgi:hypothetical protein